GGHGEPLEMGMASRAGGWPEAARMPEMELKGGDFQAFVDRFRQINWPALLASVEAQTRDYEHLLIRYRQLARQHEDLSEAHDRLRRDREEGAHAEAELAAAPQALPREREDPTPTLPQPRESDDALLETPSGQGDAPHPSDLADELVRRRVSGRGLSWVGHLA